jgi:hypothetical protein
MTSVLSLVDAGKTYCPDCDAWKERYLKQNGELVAERAAKQIFHDRWEAERTKNRKQREREILDARVDLVWQLWLTIRRGPESNTPIKRGGHGYKLGDHRKKLIQARLREEREIEEFWMCFYGAGRDLWQNRSGAWMDTIEWLCKNEVNFEKARDLFEWDQDANWGIGGVKSYADRCWAKLEAARNPVHTPGFVCCERCATKIPAVSETGLCEKCCSDLMRTAA